MHDAPSTLSVAPVTAPSCATGCASLLGLGHTVGMNPPIVMPPSREAARQQGAPE